MKDQNEFLKEMEQLQVPDISAPTHQKTVKMTIMNAERSATLGIWLIAIPCYFLLCVFIYYYYNVHANWFGAMFKLIISLEQNPYIDFIAPLVLVVLPVISIIINALAITNVKYQQYGTHQKKLRELSITIKIKFWNIVLILISVAILLVFINCAMTQNISIKY